MASEAEVDLIISTADALPQLERDLDRIITAAETTADEIEIQAVLDQQQTISALIDDVTDAIRNVNSVIPEVEIEAALDTLETLVRLQGDLDDAISTAQSTADQIQVDAELDADIAELDAEIAALVNDLERSAPEVDIEVDLDTDRAERSGLRLGSALRPLAGLLGGVAGSMSAVSLATGPAASLLAATATSVEALAPAAALAAPAILSLGLAMGTVKLATQGVGDAIKAAFDPETKPEELEKSLKNLAPEARKFVVELSSMRKGLKEVQQAVQEKFFANFDDALKDLSGTVLPQVSSSLQNVAGTFNQMGHEVANAARELAENGTLGRALAGAEKGLQNLTKVPAQATTAFGQLAAAAAPAFDRVTAAAAKAFTGVTDKLSAAFESGALEEAIDSAIDTIAQLGRIAGNVFGGLGNIISTVSVEGNGLFTVLEKVTQAFQDVTASKGFQDALKALSETANVLVDTVLPLISQALQALGPVFQALAAPVQILVRALGEGLTKVITALAPVLVAAGLAFGQLVIAVTPFIDLAANLIAAILPGLTPLFEALGTALNSLVPFIEQLATTLTDALVPVFTQLATEVLPQILPPFVELSTKLIPLLTETLVELTPSIITLASSFAELVIALTPLIVEIINLGIALLDDLLPKIQPVIDLMIKFTNFAVKVAASEITNLLIPTLKILVQLLQGDFSGAWQSAGDLVTNINNKIKEVVGAMAAFVGAKLHELKDAAVNRAKELASGFIAEVTRLGNEVRSFFTSLPGKIVEWLGDTGNMLRNAGSNIVQGLINGLNERLGRLREIAADIGRTVRDAVKSTLGIHSPSTVMREAGNDTIDGFLLGLKDQVPELSSQLQGIAGLAPSFALPGGRTLQLPDFQPQAPQVAVYLGNELLNRHVDTRIQMSNQDRNRLMSQGVRR